MQSLSRSIRRGNAVIIFDKVHQRLEVVTKRGTELGQWLWSLRNKIDYPVLQKPIVNENKEIKRRRKRKTYETTK